MSFNITIDEVKQICNLTDLKKTDILLSSFPIIEDLLFSITLGPVNKKVKSNTATPLKMTSFKHAFAFFIYAHNIDFLNTSTNANGILKNTGFAESRIELLGEVETERKQRKLELKAYSLLQKYLNADGIQRYNELKLWDDLQRAENEQAKQKILTRGKRCKIAII